MTENGLAYATLSGGLLVSDLGNPGQDMEGTASAGGGVLKIVSASGGNFNFNALDFAALETFANGSQTLMVEGFLGGSPVGVDQYTLANTNISSPNYTNWTTEAASVLAGQTLSELHIPLDAGTDPTGFFEAIDNVVLTPVAVPVPQPGSLASLALLAAGLLSLGLVHRRNA